MQPLSLPPGSWYSHHPGFLGDSGGQLLRALLPVRHGTGASHAGRRQLVLLPALGPPLCIHQAAWCCLPLLLDHAPPRFPPDRSHPALLRRPGPGFTIAACDV